MNMNYDKRVNVKTSDLQDPKIVITYDSTSDNLMAVISGKYDGKILSNRAHPTVGTANINKELKTICGMYGLSISKLASGKNRRILIDKDVIALYGIDDVNSKLLKRKTVKTSTPAPVTPTASTPIAPITPVPAPTPTPSSPAPSPSTPSGDISQSTDFDEVAKAIIALNPKVKIRLEKTGVANRRIFASIPGDRLVLPNGFYYDATNGITNKGLTTSGGYISIGVDDLSKAKEEDLVPIKSKKNVIKNKVDTVKSTTKAKLGKIKNLKIVNWKKLKTILITGSVVALLTYLAVPKGNNYVDTRSSNDDYNGNDDEINTYDDGSLDTTFNTDEEDVFYTDPIYEEDVYNETNYDVYETYYNDTYDYNLSGDMETRLNEILEICYQNVSDIYGFINGGSLHESMNPTFLESLVQNGDRDAIMIINGSRNYVVNNAYTDQNIPLTMSDVYRFLSEYVNYAFEGGTVFDNQTIKAYDYLDPYSQYIVTVVGEAMLQLYPGYEYSSPYANYTFEDLIGRIIERHSDLSESLTNGRSY